MKTKMLFVLLIVILLSSAVLADPPVNEKHKSTSGKTPSLGTQYQTHRSGMIASKERISIGLL